ncbi:MAG: ABC transporter ATP-binding protein [Acidimicrobiales bacterium]|nr:ABC transporter ATP-binding protein [Acidimicrobiales bacterium]
MAGAGIAHLRDGEDIVLRVEDLVVEFPTEGKRTVHAVSGISFDVKRGETLGLVGESGCGKSTTGRSVMQLPPPTSGSIRFAGRDLTSLSSSELRSVRRKVQMIFQDPISSLNPRRRVLDIVADPLVVWGEKKADTRAKVAEVLDAVGLDVDQAGDRHPHQFSGGQCQRISIARALVVEPEIIICDEPVSALDVSIQAQILNLLEDMKERYALTLVFIAHDLAVVRNISDRVAVMYLGKLCEIGAPQELYDGPRHHYTKLLLNSIPAMGDDQVDPVAKSEMPSPMDPPSGCRFRTRCPAATEICAEEEPSMQEVGEGHFLACHHPLPLPDGDVAEPSVPGSRV